MSYGLLKLNAKCIFRPTYLFGACNAQSGCDTSDLEASVLRRRRICNLASRKKYQRGNQGNFSLILKKEKLVLAITNSGLHTTAAKFFEIALANFMQSSFVPLGSINRLNQIEDEVTKS